MTELSPFGRFIGFMIARGGWPALILLSLLSIPLGLLAGNVIMWPLLLAWLLGIHLSDSMGFFLIALPFVLIFIAAIFFPQQGTAFFDFLGKLFGLGIASFAFVAFMLLLPAVVIGLPLLIAANYLFDVALPPWTLFPLGLAGLGLYMTIRNLRKPTA